MIKSIFTSMMLSNNCNSNVAHFYILKENLIRPDQDKIVSRSSKDYYSACFNNHTYYDLDFYNLYSKKYDCTKYSCNRTAEHEIRYDLDYYENENKIIYDCDKYHCAIKQCEVSDNACTLRNNVTMTNDLEKIKSIVPKKCLNDMNNDKWSIEWYVIKCESDGWHVDGQIVYSKHVNITFYKTNYKNISNEIYTRIHVKQGSKYCFSDDEILWKYGDVVIDENNGRKKMFIQWEQYETNETNETNETADCFMANTDMNFYAEWIYLEDEESEESINSNIDEPMNPITESNIESLITESSINSNIDEPMNPITESNIESLITESSINSNTDESLSPITESASTHSNIESLITESSLFTYSNIDDDIIQSSTSSTTHSQSKTTIIVVTTVIILVTTVTTITVIARKYGFKLKRLRLPKLHTHEDDETIYKMDGMIGI